MLAQPGPHPGSNRADPVPDRGVTVLALLVLPVLQLRPAGSVHESGDRTRTDHEMCAPEHSQRVVQRLVRAEKESDHRIAPDLRFVRVQNRFGPTEQFDITALLVLVEQLVGEEVRVAYPEVQLLQSNLAFEHGYRVGQRRIIIRWPWQRYGGRRNDQ